MCQISTSRFYRDRWGFEVLCETVLPTLAHAGRYRWASIKALPASWIAAGFVRSDAWYVVQDAFREAIDFVEQGMRQEMPTGAFHLILCRHVVLTYCTAPVQRAVLARLVALEVRMDLGQ
jgi:chemotaxis methyl-accepting protein methylase